MGLLGKIWVKLGLDNSELDKGFKDSEKSAAGFQNALKKVGGMMAAAFSVTAVINFAKASVNAYNESALAAAKLESVLKSTGGAAGLTSAQMQNFASELQKVTNFEDDATINAMALMATFKSVNGDIFKQAIISAQDLATVLGSDLNGAVMQLGKALEAPEIGLTMLRRSGISFSTEQIEQIKKLVAEGKKQEAQLIMLTEVQSQFGGAARAAANTAAGAWRQVGLAVGDLMEDIGSSVELTKKSASSLANYINGVRNVWKSNDLWFITKLYSTFFAGANDDAMQYANAEQKRIAEQKEKTAEYVKSKMKGIKTLSDAENALKNLGWERMTVDGAAYEIALKQFKVRAIAAEEEEDLLQGSIVGINNKIAALQKEKDEATDPTTRKAKQDEIDVQNALLAKIDGVAEAEAKKKAAEEAATLSEQMGLDGTIKRYQFLISEIEKKILATNVNDLTTLKALNDEKAGLQNLIKTWQMTTAEAKEYYSQLSKIEAMRAENAYFPLTTPKGRASVDAKGAGSVAFGTDSSKTEGGLFADQLKEDAENLEKFNDKFEQEVDRSRMIADAFGQAVARSISDSMKVIMDAVMSGEQIDMSSMIKAIVTPFADMAVQIGEVLVATGVAALAAKAIGTVGGGIGAIAAGAALIALGTAAQAAISNIGGGFGSGKGQGNDYNYQGGQKGMSIAGANTNINVVGILKGEDIYLSSQKVAARKKR